MLESEVLPRKFIVPIIILISLALLLPVGNYLNDAAEDTSEDISWDKTIIIAIFCLSIALAGIFLLIVITNPPNFSEKLDNEDERISYTSRENKLDSKK
jgi:di/tricarboxylate transporter